LKRSRARARTDSQGLANCPIARPGAEGRALKLFVSETGAGRYCLVKA